LLSNLQTVSNSDRATANVFILIAFYPHAIHKPQPYVILLDQASGILRRVDLQAAK